MALGSERSWDDWITRYEGSHQHPMNRLCHRFGIPIVAASVLLFIAACFVHALVWWALAAFVIGWSFQVIGHAYERKRPEFMNDWRFLFVGLRWWLRETFGHHS